MSNTDDSNKTINKSHVLTISSEDTSLSNEIIGEINFKAPIENTSKNKPHNIIIYFNNITSLWVVIGAKISGINNLAICVQNSIKNLSYKNLKLIILMRIFNILNVKLVPCSSAIRDSFFNLNKKIKFSSVIPNCINVKSFQNEVQKCLF